MGVPCVIDVTVYGAKQLCASCLHLPSSEETASWLSAALARDYGEAVRVRYVDIGRPEREEDQKYADLILNDTYAYPLVVINDEIVGEGDPRLPVIRRKLEQLGVCRIQEGK